ncbi:MAG: hypothetical protein M3Y87_12835 [Myxococcota bacterium]|nr:hypothetical protein [Myxococcota bacterium]
MDRLSPAERLQIAFELAELAEELQRGRLRRRLPDASDDEIERLVELWYRTRPGAEHGDAEGRPIEWPLRA